MLSGRWTYRSFRNETELVAGDAEAALSLLFGEGVFDLEASEGRVDGALGLGTGFALRVSGTVDRAAADLPTRFTLVGRGIEGTPTDGWRYDYRGVVAPRMSGAIDRVPCLLGTVLRVNAHGPASPAGATASFMAVLRRSAPSGAGSGRVFALLA